MRRFLAGLCLVAWALPGSATAAPTAKPALPKPAAAHPAPGKAAKAPSKPMPADPHSGGRQSAPTKSTKAPAKAAKAAKGVAKAPAGPPPPAAAVLAVVGKGERLQDDESLRTHIKADACEEPNVARPWAAPKGASPAFFTAQSPMDALLGPAAKPAADPNSAAAPRAASHLPIGDPAFLAQLRPLEFPVRYDDRLLKKLAYFRDDPRGRGLMTIFLRKSGRYRDQMEKVFASKGVPSDLIWLSMIESTFEPTARSPVGAAGLFQFMPGTGRIYGLSQDAWVDQRMSPAASTAAAADFLLDLKQRFGSWDLAIASYNVGYGGVTSSIRRYNTNDFWLLSRTEAGLPFETAEYVPKIEAVAIVAKNLDLFGFDSAQIATDAKVVGEAVSIPPNTPLTDVARAIGVTASALTTLNPELRQQRTPPSEQGLRYQILVPTGKGALAEQAFPKAADPQQSPAEPQQPGRQAPPDPASRANNDALRGDAPGKVVENHRVVVPAEDFVRGPVGPGTAKSEQEDDLRGAAGTGTERVFYTVRSCDRVDGVARLFSVSAAEIVRWNTLDPEARLLEGMTLQVFLPGSAVAALTSAHVPFRLEKDVEVIPVGSEAFFAAFDPKGRKRIVVAAHKGETLEAAAHRFHVTAGLAERINRRSRRDVLAAGEPVVLYVEDQAVATELSTAIAPPQNSPVVEPLPPLPAAPPQASSTDDARHPTDPGAPVLPPEPKS